MPCYPRDRVRYIDRRPDRGWSGGTPITVNFALNYEEGGECSVPSGDAFSRMRQAERFVPAVVRGAPAQRRTQQIVFQNPDEALNPCYSVGAQIGRVISKFGIGKNPREVKQEVRWLPSLSPPAGCPFRSRGHRKIGPGCETEKPAKQRLAQGSHRIVCHIPAAELARTATFEGTAP